MKVLKRFEWILTPSFTLISAKRVYTITEEKMFFLISLSCYSFYILLSCFKWTTSRWVECCLFCLYLMKLKNVLPLPFRLDYFGMKYKIYQFMLTIEDYSFLIISKKSYPIDCVMHNIRSGFRVNLDSLK